MIRQELNRVVQQRTDDDPKLGHLDGLGLYHEDDAATLPLPDDLHPDPATHRLIGEGFTQHWLAATGRAWVGE